MLSVWNESERMIDEFEIKEQTNTPNESSFLIVVNFDTKASNLSSDTESYDR
jgi:hypothetical protein